MLALHQSALRVVCGFLQKKIELRYLWEHGNEKNTRINYLNERNLLIPW